jgi:hypothetical protein
MITCLIVGGQVGFRLRGDLDKRVMKTYEEVILACKSHLDNEEEIRQQKRDFQNFQERRAKRPLTWI